MQRLHNELELQFLEVNKIIPYDNNDSNVYSPRYVFILQDASRQVDGLFRLIYKRLDDLAIAHGAPLSPLPRTDFCGYYDFLNSQDMLANQKLAPRDDALRTIRRLGSSNKIPQNGGKHITTQSTICQKVKHSVNWAMFFMC